MDSSQRVVLSLNLDPQLSNSSWYVEKLITQSIVKPSVVHNILKLAWEKYDAVRISVLVQHVFIFDFDNEEDIIAILYQALWSIQGHCLSIRQWDPQKSLRDVEFVWVQFWIQIHGLELKTYTTKNAWVFGNSVGRCLEIEE